MIPQLIHISTQPTLHGIFKPDKIQPGQMLILVVDGIPYSGQRQINGKPLKLLRKGRDLQLQIQGLIAFSADNFFTDAASSSRPDDGGNLVVPTDHSTDSTAVDIQTLLQEGSAVQVAAVDRGLLSDASNSVLGQPWQSRLVAQAPDTASTTTSKSGATLELAVPSMLDSNHDREGYLVLLMAGLSVALVAGRGGASQSLETFPVWLEPHDETSVPDWIPADFGIVVVSSATFAENGTGAVYTAAATPDVTGASISYSISGGADSAKFSVNSSSGVVGFKSSPDFETPTDAGGDNVYDLVISATEVGNTRSATRSVAVTVTDVGDVAPAFTSGSSTTFTENGTGAVYTAAATPDVTGVSMSYSISGGTDSAKFSINSSSGVVGFKTSPDFETPTDAGSDNVYNLVISATEVGNTRSATRSVAVTVSDVGDVAPAFTSGSSTTFTENGTGAVYTAAAAPDVTGVSMSYSISGGTDSAKFSINSSSGVVGFKTSPDFESPTDAGGDNVYDLIVSATEVGNTRSATRSVAVTVTDVGDVAPAFTSGSSTTFAENGTGAVYTAAATPDVTGASISYSISGGADSAKFSVNSSSGVVGFKTSPDFETPTDAGSDNVYNLVISATEVGNTRSATRSVAVTVTDVGDVAPNFTSGSSTTFTENGTGAVYTAAATPDVTGVSMSYSISGGTDSAKFSINSSSGVVGFVSSPDFETATDAGGDNIYNLVISATEVGNTFIATRSVAVTVTDVGDVAPAFSSASSTTFAENDTGAVYTAVATPDVTGAGISYSISGGTDSAKFSINSSSGVVGFVSSPDFETPTDAGGDNVYNLVISATESGNTRSATRSVAVTVSDVGDVAPAFSSGSSATFAENGTGAVYTAVATPDVTGASISYSISGGADSAQFSINSNSGVVGFVSSPDFESPTDAGGDNVYDLVIQATEIGNTRSATRSVAVTVTDVGDVAPAFSSGSSATFAENGTGAVYTAVATPDVTGASISYSISGGLDAAQFSINNSSGVVSFKSSPDFETPTDAGGDNVYDLIISATESGNTRSATRSVAVTVSDVGDVAPNFTSGSSTTFTENGTGAVYTAVATPDVTGASMTYSISGGTDSAKFSINSNSGVVGFKSSPDFETPNDAGGDNVYNLVISATEVGNTFIATRSVAVTVQDVNELAPSFASGNSASFAENGTGVAYTALATPRVSGSMSYSISGGTDSAKFSINSSSGVVGFASSPDFETPTDAGGDNVYDLVIQATEIGNTRSATRSVAVTVTDVGDVAPAFSSASSTTFAENGTGAVYTAVATPDVTGAGISYSISGGTDSAKFSINSSSGVVGFVSSPDFETPTDAGGDNVYDLVIQATEIGNTRSATRSVAVTVTDVGDAAPGFTSGSSATIAENGTGAVYTAVATPDVTGAGISYSISGGTDSAKFSINSSSGVVGFVSSPDFETPTDAGGDNVYDLVIQATEIGNTRSATRSVAVTVTDVGDAAPGFTSGSSATIAENGTGAVYTAVATPDVTGAGISYSISGGTDSAKFSINSSSGVVGFVSSPDFETPTDAGGDNVYDLVIQATEIGNTRSATRSVAVTVTDVGDAAPGFTSGSSATIAENGTGAVYTAAATPDVTGVSMSYSISGGTDSAKFSINSSSGVVGFKTSPDFETPTDAGGDNVYDLIVSATEVGNTFIATRSVAVTVQDVNELAPSFASGNSASFAENGTGVAYTALATPRVSGSMSYSISGGADSAQFSINSSSGVVGFKSSPDFETPTDAGSDNVYNLVISATEVGNTFIATRSVAVTVQDVNELAPIFTSGNSASFAENGTGVAYTALATPRVSGSMSYSISGGADSAQFSINSSSGVVGFKTSPDFETPTDAGSDNVYNLVISATESGNTRSATQSVAVTVTDVGDVAPVFGGVSSATFAENGTGAVYTAVATPDVTGAGISYSISGGTDSAKFSINSSSGVVGFVSSPDFETPTDAGGDNVYNLVISATEVGNTRSATRSVAVTVTDVGDAAPGFTSGSSATIAENGTGAVYTAVATPDVTGAGISYSISGGTDSAKFSINSSSGVVGFVSSPDFETPTDAGGDNVYDLVIQATEIGNTRSATRSVAVTVSDVGDVAPAFSSASSTTFAENGTGAVYTAVATPDVTGASMTYSISGGTDSAKFSINSNSGVVGFKSSPDFETPTDAGSDNVYNLVISATESGNTRSATQSVAVTVTDVGDAAPGFTSASSTTFAENGTGAVYTAVATPDVTGASMTYSISGGTDSAKFSVNSSSGVVGFKSSPDFETPTDAGGDNVYDLIVSATEVGNTFIATRSVAVTVTDVGDVAPVFGGVSSATFAENGTGAVYTAVATPDVTGGSIRYSISGGTDSAKFSINSSSGVVGFVSSPDFETPTDAGSDNIYNLVISATEVGNTFIATRSVAVTVQDVNELAPSFASGNSASFAENGTGVAYTALATPRVSGSMSYSISGGADSAQFSINSSSGAVGWKSSPNHESTTDAGGDNVYNLVISATESGNTRSATQSVAVTVTDVGDVAPVFGGVSSATFAENGTGVVYTAAATPDVTGVSMSYSISGGTDSAKFSINSSSGVVGFKSSPDFESPTDAGGDNVYDLIVSATEVGNTFIATRSVAVTVQDVNELAPSFASGNSASFAENGTGVAYTALATPRVSGSMSYRISGGADSAQFSINSSSGVVGFKSSPDFETPTDTGGDNVYNLVISATEVGNTFIATRSVAVTVTDVGDVAPAFSSGSSTTFTENGTSAVYTAAATPDVTGAGISYSISGGTDSAKFSINSSSGVVGFVSSPDFETATDAGGDNVYNLVISATEVGNTFIATRSVAVTVTDVGDVAPAFSSASSTTFTENGTGAVYTAVATPDVTGASMTYSISGGADSAQFSINSNSGVVGFKSSPDFETPNDAGGDNFYNLVISATESGNTRSATQGVAVTVSNVGDVAPAFSSGSSTTFAENGTGAVYTAVATPDVTGASISYSISGGADSAQFSINSSSGVVGFVSSPDFETPTDAGGDNVYDLIISATESGNTRSATQSVAVTVSDVGDVAPAFSSGSSATFAENGTGAVYTAAATPDVTGVSMSYSISGGTDSAKFSINSSSGVVGFVSSPDFETATDAGGDNVYNLVISATEVGNTFIATRSVAVTVTDVGDVAPAFSSASSTTFAENGTGAVYTAVATPDVTGASMTYSISGGADSAQFSINSNSGVVGFKSSPDFETPNDAGGDNVYTWSSAPPKAEIPARRPRAWR